MRFRFNKGDYLQAHDNDGNPYPTEWRTLNTGKMFDNKDLENASTWQQVLQLMQQVNQLKVAQV